MTGRTTIEWTHMPGFVGAVWNPTVGCTRVSAGCDNCYAFALHDKRYKSNLDAAVAQTGHTSRDYAREHGAKLPYPKQYDLPFSQVQLLPDRLDVPLRTRKPTCYFVDSMADLFHEDVPDEFLDRTFAAMSWADKHRFLILTKRPDRMRSYLSDPAVEKRVEDLRCETCMTQTRAPCGFPGDDCGHMGLDEWPLQNVWLGTSVEDQRSADERIPHLLETPAAVRFLSCEPLLGPVELTHFGLGERTWHGEAGEVVERDPGIQWVIVGGESGPRARPMDLAWARSLVAQCRAAGVAPFVKQLGSNPIERIETLKPGHAFFDGDLTPVMERPPSELQQHGWTRVTTPIETYYSRQLRLRESHGRDMAEWPEDLRVREWPR